MQRVFRILRASLPGVLGAVLGVALAAGTARAQTGDGPATLIADRITFGQAAQTVTATGSVEIFYRDLRLRARRVTYDGAAERLQVDGPLTLIEGDGSAVLIAEFAALDADLQTGVLEGARLVLDRQLQIAAARIARTGGRFTQGAQVVASSCRVCANSPTPLWEIRADRVIHDQLTRQIYFERATFRALGVPIAYLPRLRVPDPTLARSTGFLAPGFGFTDATGPVLRLPYFITLGDHADLTLTPWLEPHFDTATLGLRYRQAFARGTVALGGTLSAEGRDIDDLRGQIDGSGSFDLGRGVTLDFGIEAASDRSYPSDYGLPERDLLESFARLRRTDAATHAEARVARFSTLRAGEDNDTLATQMASARIVHRFAPRVIGGTATATLDAGAYRRPSDLPGAGGRDGARVTGALDWRRDAVLAGGMLVALDASVTADLFETRQSGGADGQAARVTPRVAFELRYPLSRAGGTGVTHLIEPVAQLIWSESYGDAGPAEDSARTIFDEASLFALDRLIGEDTRETGLRANLGLSYSRIDPTGLSLGVTAGMVLRAHGAAQVAHGSGLSGTRSDLLVAAHLQAGDGLRLVNRALIDDALSLGANDLALGWQGTRLGLETALSWLRADPGAGRARDIGDWRIDARYDLGRDWQASVSAHYDLVAATPREAGVGLSFVNECVDLAFSLSRKYATPTRLTASTEIGLTISLNGFGAGRSGRDQGRRCLR